MPYLAERVDSLWSRGDIYDPAIRHRMTERPSTVAARQIFGCIYDDVAGLRAREQIGMSQLMFESDYPHADSTFPNTAAVAQRLVDEVGLNDEETYQFLRGNAISCYRLDRYGVDR